MATLCAWAANPDKRSANSAMTADCAWAICRSEGVKWQQICLGEMRVWMRFGSIPWLKIGSDALWLHPVIFIVKIQLDAILAPTRLKVYGTKLVDALWLHPVHGKFDMDKNRLHI